MAAPPGGLRQVVTPALRGGNFEQLLQFSPDGHWLAVGGKDAVLVYDRTTLALRLRCPTAAAVDSLAFSPDSAHLTAGLESNQLPLWRVEDGALVRTIASPRTSAIVGFSLDGALQIAGYGVWVGAWRVADGKLEREFVTRVGALGSMTVAAAGDGVYVILAVIPSATTNTAQPVELQVRRLADGGVVSEFAGPLVGATALTGVGPILAMLTREGIELWPLVAGAKRYPVQGTTGFFPDTTQALAFSPDGTLLVCGTTRGQVLLWRVSDGALLASYQTRNIALISVALDPTNQTLAALDRDGGVWLWQR